MDNCPEEVLYSSIVFRNVTRKYCCSRLFKIKLFKMKLTKFDYQTLWKHYFTTNWSFDNGCSGSVRV